MTGLPLTLRRSLTPPAAIAPLAMPSTPILVAKLLPRCSGM
jgi:hypothetical protein